MLVGFVHTWPLSDPISNGSHVLKSSTAHAQNDNDLRHTHNPYRETDLSACRVAAVAPDSTAYPQLVICQHEVYLAALQGTTERQQTLLMCNRYIHTYIHTTQIDDTVLQPWPQHVCYSYRVLCQSSSVL